MPVWAWLAPRCATARRIGWRGRRRALCARPASSPRASRDVSEVLREARRALAANAVPEPRRSAEFLLAAAMGVRALPPAAWVSHSQMEIFGSLMERRIRNREPVQYLVGNWDFHNLTDVLVRPPVLIPRPETEELVELILHQYETRAPPSTILDVGCGSGVIGLALAAAWRQRTGVQPTLVCLDPSADAIALTHENADRFHLQISSVQDHIHSFSADGKPFDLIVSNPPYIPLSDMAALEPEVKQHEDWNALQGGLDGLDVVRDILHKIASVATSGASVWLEVDDSHPDHIRDLVQTSPGLQWQAQYRDLSGNPRFCHFTNG